MNRPSTDATVNIETLKLLLQVAWADDVLEPSERQAIASLGAQWGIPNETLAVLLSHLESGKPLPQPNLALLRQHGDVVRSAAQWFVSVDGVRSDTERDVLATVDELLGT